MPCQVAVLPISETQSNCQYPDWLTAGERILVASRPTSRIPLAKRGDREHVRARCRLHIKHLRMKWLWEHFRVPARAIQGSPSRSESVPLAVPHLPPSAAPRPGQLGPVLRAAEWRRRLTPGRRRLAGQGSWVADAAAGGGGGVQLLLFKLQLLLKGGGGEGELPLLAAELEVQHREAVGCTGRARAKVRVGFCGCVCPFARTFCARSIQTAVCSTPRWCLQIGRHFCSWWDCFSDRLPTYAVERPF